MIKINYFDERELLVKKDIETKTSKNTKTKDTQVLADLLGVIQSSLNSTKSSIDHNRKNRGGQWSQCHKESGQFTAF